MPAIFAYPQGMGAPRFTRKQRQEARLADNRMRHGHITRVHIAQDIHTGKIIAVAVTPFRVVKELERINPPEGSWEVKDYPVFS